MRYEITLFDSVVDVGVYSRNQYKMTWSDLESLLTHHNESGSKEDNQLFVPASFEMGATRSKHNVLSYSCLILDYDDGTHPNYWLQEFPEYQCIIYSSYSHSKELAKFRVVIPLDEPITVQEFSKYRELLKFKFKDADPASFSASQAFYLPSCPEGAETIAHTRSGRPITKRWLEVNTDALASLKAFEKRYESQGEVDVWEVERVLNRIDPELPYDQWIKTCTAVKRELGEEGRDVWIAWSSKHRDADKIDYNHKWDSLSDSYNFNFGTLRWLSREYAA